MSLKEKNEMMNLILKELDIESTEFHPRCGQPYVMVAHLDIPVHIELKEIDLGYKQSAKALLISRIIKALDCFSEQVKTASERKEE